MTDGKDSDGVSCGGCGRTLTENEVYYYGASCEHCERALMETNGRQYHAGKDMDARARVKRPEASVQAEKELSTYWMERSSRAEAAMDNAKRLVAEGETDQSVLLEALRHAPPESDPCKTCNGTGVKTWRNERWGVPDEIASCKCRDCDAPHTPQAHGDALAAAEESLRFLEGDGYRVSPRLVRHHHDNIRQALAASGVPYVPEEVRCLLMKWRARGDGRGEPWRCADELKQALASAPAVPDGMRTAWPTRDVLTKLADAADILLDRYNHDADGWEMIAHARDVARQRAAAPTDGRE